MSGASIASAIARESASRSAGTPMRPGPRTLRRRDAVIGCLREAGFSDVMAEHAYSLPDSYVYGFAMQRADLLFQTPEETTEVAGTIL